VKINLDPYHQMGSQEVGYEGRYRLLSDGHGGGELRVQ